MEIGDEQINRLMLLITGNSKEFNVCKLKLAMNKEIKTHFCFAYAWNTCYLTGQLQTMEFSFGN